MKKKKHVQALLKQLNRNASQILQFCERLQNLRADLSSASLHMRANTTYWSSWGSSTQMGFWRGCSPSWGTVEAPPSSWRFCLRLKWSFSAADRGYPACSLPAKVKARNSWVSDSTAGHLHTPPPNPPACSWIMGGSLCSFLMWKPPHSSSMNLDVQVLEQQLSVRGSASVPSQNRFVNHHGNHGNHCSASRLFVVKFSSLISFCRSVAWTHVHWRESSAPRVSASLKIELNLN